MAVFSAVMGSTLPAGGQDALVPSPPVLGGERDARPCRCTAVCVRRGQVFAVRPLAQYPPCNKEPSMDGMARRENRGFDACRPSLLTLAPLGRSSRRQTGIHQDFAG